MKRQTIFAFLFGVLLSYVVVLAIAPPHVWGQQSGPGYAGSAFDLSATAATNVKASGGNVFGWYGYNPNGSVCYLQFYNSTSAVLGTSVLHPFGVAAGASFNVSPGALGFFNFSTGISTGETTTATGSSQCASPMIITIMYQ